MTTTEVRHAAACERIACGWTESSATPAGALLLADEHARRTRHPVRTDVPTPAPPPVPVAWAVVDSHDRVQGVHQHRGNALAVAVRVDGWTVRPLVMLGLDDVVADVPDGAQ